MFKIYYFKLVFIIGFSLGVNAPEGIWSVGTYLPTLSELFVANTT